MLSHRIQCLLPAQCSTDAPLNIQIALLMEVFLALEAMKLLNLQAVDLLIPQATIFFFRR
jgi:hypothetical protein